MPTVNRVTKDPSDQPVSLQGSAILLVTLRNTAWQTAPSPQPTITPGFPAANQPARDAHAIIIDP